MLFLSVSLCKGIFGKTINKKVKIVGVVFGTVKSYYLFLGFFEILYDGGDSEELESSDVVSLLEAQPELTKAKPRVDRKPQMHCPVEQKVGTGGSSVNVGDNLVSEGSEF